MKPDGANRENLNREDASENTPHSHRAVRRLVTLHAVLTAVLFVAFGACLNLIRHSLANELLAGLLVAAAATQAALLGAWLAFGVGVGKPQPRGLLKSAAAVIGVYVLGFFVMWNEPPPLWASLVVWLPIKLAVCTMGVCVLLAPPWFATVTVGFAAREYGWSWMDEQTPPGDEPQFSLRTLMLFLLVVTAFVFVAAITRGPRYSPYSPTSGDGAAFPVLYLMAFAAAPALAVVVSFGPRQRLAPCAASVALAYFLGFVAMYSYSTSRSPDSIYTSHRGGTLPAAVSLFTIGSLAVLRYGGLRIDRPRVR